MENNEKSAEKVKDIFLELEKNAKDTNERLRLYLKNLSKDDMIAKINGLNLSDKSLNFLCEGIALETEDYEICAAVEEVKRARRSTQATTAI